MTAPLRLTDRKREAIVLAAIDAFRSGGFETTSMDSIAALAGASKRTVYNHFPSKEALFSEILNRLWSRSAVHAQLAYRPEQPVRRQLQDLMMQKMQLFNDRHFLDLARVAIAATLHNPERAQEIVARLADLEDSFNQWIRAAQADGKLKAVDPAFATHQLHGMLKAFAFWPQLTLDQPPLDAQMQRRVVDSSVELFLAGYEIVAKH